MKMMTMATMQSLSLKLSLSDSVAYNVSVCSSLFHSLPPIWGLQWEIRKSSPLPQFVSLCLAGCKSQQFLISAVSELSMHSVNVCTTFKAYPSISLSPRLTIFSWFLCKERAPPQEASQPNFYIQVMHGSKPPISLRVSYFHALACLRRAFQTCPWRPSQQATRLAFSGVAGVSTVQMRSKLRRGEQG